MVGYSVSGAAGFIGAWVTIKAVGGWARWSGDKSDWARALFSAGLLGSITSVLFGVWSGLLIADAKHIDAPMNLVLVIAVLLLAIAMRLVLPRLKPPADRSVGGDFEAVPPPNSA